MAQRINRVIELLEQDQPAYGAWYSNFHECGVELSYDGGRRWAREWADFIHLSLEHDPFDLTALAAFMQGLVDGGPTASGHRTPAVIVEVPSDGGSEATVRANAWQFRQVLALGVHGLLLCHTETPEAAGAFVESCRYPFQSLGVGNGALGQGRRGAGSQVGAGRIWGLEARDYLRRADAWPLNPEGELLLGVKIENRRALDRAEQTTRVPGLAFCESGRGDMGLSLGYPDPPYPPYPPDIQAAYDRVKAAGDAAGLRFLHLCTPDNVVAQIDSGVRLFAPTGDGTEAARIGRAHTGRTMPV